MASSLGHHLERPLSSSSPRVKVSLSDTRLCRQVSQHSTLTSYQQLRKVNHIEVKRVNKHSRHSPEKWVERHLRHDPQPPICRMRRLRR